MRILPSLVLAAGLISNTAAWADPVPADKIEYVGNWQGKDPVDLSIDLKGFKGSNFEAGLAFMRTTFAVGKPPHREEGMWKMTVDGVELTRVD